MNQAHNDYLQLLVETGLAGFSIAIWFLVLVFRRAVGKLENWTETASGAMTMARCSVVWESWSTAFSISICRSRQTPRCFTFSARLPPPHHSRNRNGGGCFGGTV